MSFILRAWPIVREKEGNRPGPLEWCKGSVALTRGQGREAEPYNKPIKIGLLPLFPVKNICSKAPAPYNNTYIFFIIFKEYIRGWALLCTNTLHFLPWLRPGSPRLGQERIRKIIFFLGLHT